MFGFYEFVSLMLISHLLRYSVIIDVLLT